MANPRVSVIIPYFNAGKFIEEAIASIREQAYTPLEIILVDDGSTDRIADRVEAWGEDIVFLRQENKGQAAARNRGITHATGDIIAFLDADDYWPHGKLTRQVGQLEDDPTLGIVTGRVEYIWTGVPLECQSGRAQGHLGARVVRKWVFREVGLFDESLRFHEDLDWSLRARERHIPTVRVKETVLFYRRHDANITCGTDPYKSRLLAVLKQSLDRRKALHGGQVRSLPPIWEADDG
jgi:glycosyltransferase involved in cell wall biosynthesis